MPTLTPMELPKELTEILAPTSAPIKVRNADESKAGDNSERKIGNCDNSERKIGNCDAPSTKLASSRDRASKGDIATVSYSPASPPSSKGKTTTTTSTTDVSTPIKKKRSSPKVTPPSHKKSKTTPSKPVEKKNAAQMTLGSFFGTPSTAKGKTRPASKRGSEKGTASKPVETISAASKVPPSKSKETTTTATDQCHNKDIEKHARASSVDQLAGSHTKSPDAKVTKGQNLLPIRRCQLQTLLSEAVPPHKTGDVSSEAMEKSVSESPSMVHELNSTSSQQSEKSVMKANGSNDELSAQNHGKISEEVGAESQPTETQLHDTAITKETEVSGSNVQIEEKPETVECTKTNQRPKRKRRASVQKVTESQPQPSSASAATTAVKPLPISTTVVEAKTESKPEPPVLTEEQTKLITKYNALQTRYSDRAKELMQQACTSGFEEEEFDMPDLTKRIVSQAEVDKEEFPGHVIANMVILIEASACPLNELALKIQGELKNAHSYSWSNEAITAKLKLLAQRNSYLEPWGSDSTSVDLFENADADRLWRWKVTTLELLPSVIQPKVRKARAARNAVSSFVTSLKRLVHMLEHGVSKITSTGKIEPSMIANVSKQEEKVLGFERKAEKQRLAELARKQKLQEEEAKKQERKLALEERRKEKERKKAEIEQKKLEAAQMREEEKKQKLTKIDEEKEQAQTILKKQKASFMSFFGKQKQTAAGISEKPKQAEDPSTAQSSPAAAVNVEPATATASISAAIHPSKSTDDDFDVDKFRALVKAQYTCIHDKTLFSKPSKLALQSRKRRARRVNVSVYVTTYPEEGVNPFDANQQPFAELKTVQIHNRYRFLMFNKDFRPPYFGTWSKRSKFVNGRRPFGKDVDVKALDYDYDSEAEWEEGDDEIGEDVEDEQNNNDDEEGDIEDDVPSNYNYEDGFCVADDEYLAIDENVDEETKMLYKKQLQTTQQGGLEAQTVCIIAPGRGGIPTELDSDHYEKDFSHMEGFEVVEACRLGSQHECQQLLDIPMCLDAYPPALMPEDDDDDDVPTASTTVPTLGKDEYHSEDLQTMARFVHHNASNSKEKLVEELRGLHSSVFDSRAKATRKLDAIADKKRRVGGVYWEVKETILKELGLNDVLGKKHDFELIAEKKVTPADAKQSPSAKKVASPKPSKKVLSPKKPKTGTAVSKSKSPKAAATPTTESMPKAKAKLTPKKRKTPEKTTPSAAKKLKMGSKTTPLAAKTLKMGSREATKSKPKSAEPKTMLKSVNLLANFLVKKKNP